MIVAERGAIHSQEAYALGKMLDHSSWQKGVKLVRLITPSDIDAVFDNAGAVVFSEFSSSCSKWEDIRRGQRLMYENSIRGTKHCAVVCKHSVQPSEARPIDSKLDVEAFQIMIHDHDFLLSRVFDASDWPVFIDSWCRDAALTRRTLIANWVRQQKGLEESQL